VTDDVEVVLEHRADRHRYEAWVDGALAGFAEYRNRPGDVTVFTHTQVDDAYEGHGVGSRLIRFALEDVRQRGGRLVARCPFVADFVREHPAYADLLADSG
jgi:predicted GNAT family acetyltransferase